MKQYRSKYGYDIYWCEGDEWKHPKQWKKNRPLCGARCRDGHACKAKVVVHPKTDKPLNGRCRMHGGLSSGAKTPEGKELCRQAASRGMKEYWRKRKEDLVQSVKESLFEGR